MADAKMFPLPAGMNAATVGQALEEYLRARKQLEVEGVSAPDGGYFIQARQGEDWKKFIGMDKAVQIQIKTYGDAIALNVGAGRWVDKIGAAMVGYVLFAPLMVTAALGALGQGTLKEDIFFFVERFVLMGGKPMDINDFAPAGAGGAVCPNCHTALPAQARFCPQCGAPAAQPRTCPECHAAAPAEAKFCVSCGAPLEEEGEA